MEMPFLPAVLVLILQQTMLLGIGMAAGTSRELNRNRELIPVSEHYGGIFRIVFGKALVYSHGLRRDGNVSYAGGSQAVQFCKYGNVDHHLGFLLPTFFRAFSSV